MVEREIMWNHRNHDGFVFAKQFQSFHISRLSLSCYSVVSFLLQTNRGVAIFFIYFVATLTSLLSVLEHTSLQVFLKECRAVKL
jgi:hypothetical protein